MSGLVDYRDASSASEDEEEEEEEYLIKAKRARMEKSGKGVFSK